MTAKPIITPGTTTGYLGNAPDTWLMFLYENKAILGYTQGVAKFVGGRHDITTGCYLDPTNQRIICIPTTIWGLKGKSSVLVRSTPYPFNFGCVESYACIGGEDCAGRSCSTFGSRISFDFEIPIRSINWSSPGSPGPITVTPGNSTLTISYRRVDDPTGGEVWAYYIVIIDSTTGERVVSGYMEAGKYTTYPIGGLTNGKLYNVEVLAVSHNDISGPIATGSGTPVGATNPEIFSICWGKTVPINCGPSPSQPLVPSGTSFNIKADIINKGPNGKVRCVFKDGTTVISDQNTTLDSFTSPITGPYWSPSFNFTMPNRDISLTVEAYGWDGSKWVLTNTKSAVISKSVPTCLTIDLRPYTASVQAGQVVNFTATVTGGDFTVNFKLRDGTLLGSKMSSGGVASFAWTTPSGVGATYYVHGEVGTPVQCTSTESTIVVSPPIRQWNLNITVKDVNTNNPISGATVVAKGQTKTTDTNGYVTFRLDEGTIDISISKTNYNTYTTAELLFSDLTKSYWLSPIVPTTGSLRFITVPTGADIYLYNETTKRGTTDISSGALLITGLTAGATPYKVKKTGYNDSTGTATVVGGVTTDVYVTLSPVTPTTGSVCLKSTPSGASIEIDGSTTGKTTALSIGACTSGNTVSGLSPGTHTYKLTLTGYQDKTGTFTIAAGQTINVDVGTLTPITNVGILSITSNPIGARVYIDNVDTIRVTPATIMNIPVGSHTYTLKLSGYEDKTGIFTIVANQTTTIDAGNLTPKVEKPGMGMFLVIGGLVAFVYIITKSTKEAFATPPTIGHL